MVSFLTIAGTLVLCGVIVWFVIVNTKKQAYTGVVARKYSRDHDGADDNTYTTYHLVVKTDDGQEKTVSLSKKTWESFAEGDKIIKVSGKFNPTKG